MKKLNNYLSLLGLGWLFKCSVLISNCWIYCSTPTMLGGKAIAGQFLVDLPELTHK